MQEAASKAPAKNFCRYVNINSQRTFGEHMTGKPRIPRDSEPLPPRTTTETTLISHGDKAALRKTLAAARRALDPVQKQQWDGQICARVMAWWRRETPREIGVYWPLAGEPDLHLAYAELAQAGVRLALPVVHEKEAALGFAEWAPGEPMVRDRMGVAVPQLLRPVERPPVLVIPCLGFNPHGYRLGYGGGYYDRTLAPHPRPRTLGIAYALAAASFADDPHDVALDMIITEQAWYAGQDQSGDGSRYSMMSTSGQQPPLA